MLSEEELKFLKLAEEATGETKAGRLVFDIISKLRRENANLRRAVVAVDTGPTERKVEK